MRSFFGLSPFFRVLLFSIVFLQTAHAARERVNGRINGPSLTGYSLTVYDTKYNTLLANTQNFKEVAQKTTVRLGVNNYNTTYATFSIAVAFKVTYLTYNINGNFSLPLTKTFTLAISNNASTTSAAYTDLSSYTFDGGYAVTTKVENVYNYLTSAYVNTTTANVYAETELEAERYYNLDYITVPYYVSPSNTNTLTIDYISTSNEFEVRWNGITGVEEFDLEWTWVSKDIPTAYTTINYIDFRNNSTRVRTSEHKYKITNVFEKGKVFFRVRGVGKYIKEFPAGTYSIAGDCYTPWTWPDVTQMPGTLTAGIYGANSANVPFYYDVDYNSKWHQRDKNWQYSSAYAEEGKKKEVISYFDGSLRNRQTVTKNNSDNSAIVAETYYDYQGRPAVQSMPVPVQSPTLTFYESGSGAGNFGFNFKSGSSTTPYGRAWFDEDGGNCDLTTIGMDPNKGSALYYSINNSDKTLQQAFVPDAEEFPFTQTIYTPDNTGRISKQSSVGKEFKMSSGRETKSFYGTPTGQVELDRLFGSEAGDYKHYKKNMVMDPNGQISISYLNQSGKTVATVLAGNTPGNLTALPSNASAPITADLLNKNNTTDTDTPQDNNNISADGTALVYKSELLVTNTGIQKFYYDMTGTSLTYGCGANICYDCIYDLQIDILDNCGNRPPVSSGGSTFVPKKRKVGNFLTGEYNSSTDVVTLNTTCLGSGDVLFNDYTTTPIQVYLQPGVYTVIKKLTVNKDAMNYYLNQYLTNSPCVTSESTFISNSTADISGCNLTCEQCVTALGTESDFITAGGTSAEFAKLVKDCREPCNFITTCEASYFALLADVSPGGQYADWKSNNGCDPSIHQLSLLNTNNKLSQRYGTLGTPTWTNANITYYNEDGTTASSVTVTKLGTSTYSPDIRTSFIPGGAYPSAPWISPNSFLMIPQGLANACDFKNYWQKSWAKSLVIFHPEYPYYQWCIENSKDLNSGNNYNVTLNSVTKSIKSSKDYDSLIMLTDNLSLLGSGDLNKLVNPLSIDYATASSSTATPNDPYFAEDSCKWHLNTKTGNGTYTWIKQYAGTLAGYKNVIDRFKDYKGTGYNLWQVAYLNAANCNCDGLSVANCWTKCGSGYTNPLNFTNAQWAKFKMLYEGLKQEMQAEAAESFATNGHLTTTLAQNCCNDCIGNSGYGVLLPPFATEQLFWSSNYSGANIAAYAANWFLTPTNAYEAPCGIAKMDLYKNKTKRFQATSDIMDLQGSINPTANIYQLTGKCPLVSDLEMLFNSMNKNAQLTSVTNFTNVPAFTKLLYDEIYKDANSGNMPGSYPGFTWSPSYSGGNNKYLTASIIDATSNICTTTFSFASGSSFNWTSNILLLSDFKFSAYASSTSTFTAKAVILSGSTTYTEQLTGTSCLNLGSCAYDPVCKGNGIAAGMKALFDQLAQSGDDFEITASGPNLNAMPYSVVYANALGQLLPSATNHDWIHTAATNACSITPNSGTETLFFIFNSTDLSAFKTLVDNTNSSSIKVLSVLPRAYGAVGEFDMIYSYVSGTLMYGTLKGTAYKKVSSTSTPLSVGSCDIKNNMCDTKEHQVRTDLEGFLKNAFANGYFANNLQTTVTNNLALTTVLKNYVSPNGYMSGGNVVQSGFTLTTNTSASAQFSASLCTDKINVSPSSAASCCKLNFTTTASGKTQNSIIASGELKVSEFPKIGGQSYNFTLAVKYSDNSVGEIYGTTSCFPLRACATCESSTDFSAASPNCINVDDFETGSSPSGLDVSAASTGCTSGIGVGTSSNMGGCDYYIGNSATWTSSGSSWDGSNHTLTNSSKAYVLSYKGDKTSLKVYEKTITIPSDTKCYGFSGKYIAKTGIDALISAWLTSYPSCADYQFELYVNSQLVGTQKVKGTFTWELLNFGGAKWTNSNLTSVPVKIMVTTIDPFSTGCVVKGVFAFDDFKLCEAPCGIVPCVSVFVPDTFPTITYTNPCEELANNTAIIIAKDNYIRYLEEQKKKFVEDYINKCIGSCKENFTTDYTNGEYHYTLYYFDQAGNLVRTVPPASVTIVASTNYAQIRTDRNNYYSSSKVFFTDHKLKTTYTYNSLNQLSKQETPDAGISRFWYDKLGRMVSSQNAKQWGMGNSGPYYYSYTSYDALGRITDVGQVRATENFTAASLSNLKGYLNPSTNNFPVNLSSIARTEVTRTFYGDDPTYLSSLASVAGFEYPNIYMRNRVGSTMFQDPYNSTVTSYSHATFYNYDVHGNVKELVQHNPDFLSGQEKKMMQYDYDLISGKVNMVRYQAGKYDQFFHKYEYDAENRLTIVTTSRDSSIWDMDAKYFYYKHGPLSRVEIGDNKVQGYDYAYTLQGWIKAVNSNELKAVNDIGKDGYATAALNYSNLHKWLPADAYGYDLNYYTNSSLIDYKAINTTYNTATAGPLADFSALSNLSTEAPGLFNGNISHMVNTFLNRNASVLNYPNGSGSIPAFTPVTQLSAFQYDQLNRIKQAKVYLDFNFTTCAWTNTSYDRFKEQLTYDPNGNIQTLKRSGNGSAAFPNMDDLAYNYTSASNKLAYVDDNTSLSGSYSTDIDDQSSGNYTYDAIGNLISDASENISPIDWTIYGKIKAVTRSSGTANNLEFKYDAQGNRISKKSTPNGSYGYNFTTFYVRDAQGNVMAEYTKDYNVINDPTIVYKLTERPIYGSNRLGVLNSNANCSTASTSTLCQQIIGNKYYELDNHLGNVYVTVSDRKLPVETSSGSGVIGSYLADIMKITNYMAYGNEMPNLSWTGSGGSYRYGFNGKENDGETTGNSGGTQDYGMRIYNPSLGKFLSVDPLTQEYPELTPYQFASNTPVQAIDLDGLEQIHYSLTKNDGKTVFKFVSIENDWVDCNLQDEATYVNYNGIEFRFVNSPGPDELGIGQLNNFVKDPEAVLTANAKDYDEFVDGVLVGSAVGMLQQLTNSNSPVMPKLRTNPAAKSQAAANGGVQQNGAKKTDYSGTNPKKGAKEGADFTKAQKKAILEKNKQANGGVYKDDVNGNTLNQPKKDIKGVKTDMNSAQVDHIKPKSKGGSNAGSNAQVISKESNTKKGNKTN